MGMEEAFGLWARERPGSFWAFVAVCGAFWGSLVNVLAYRFSQWWCAGKPFFRNFGGRSHCPDCARVIPAWANMPVLSWCLLRGRSHCCVQTIHWRYPAVELAALVMTVLLGLVAGPDALVRWAIVAWLGFALIIIGLYRAMGWSTTS